MASKKDQWIGWIERPSLLGGDLLQHGVRDRRYQVRRDVNAVQIAQKSGDLGGAHAARVYRAILSSHSTPCHCPRLGAVGTTAGP